MPWLGGDKSFHSSQEANIHGCYVGFSILFNISIQSSLNMQEKLTHEPAADGKKQRIDCSPSDQNAKVQSYP
jgi:hypothetical protein